MLATPFNTTDTQLNDGNVACINGRALSGISKLGRKLVAVCDQVSGLKDCNSAVVTEVSRSC